jgi:hypothetical protein
MKLKQAKGNLLMELDSERDMTSEDKQKVRMVQENMGEGEDEMSEIYGEISMVRKRRTTIRRNNVSFESEIHNIYDPKFSTPTLSIRDEESVVENYVSAESFIQEKKLEYYYQPENPEFKKTTKEIHYLNKMTRINSEKLKDSEHKQFELLLKNEHQSHSSSYSKYLNSNKKRNNDDIDQLISYDNKDFSAQDIHKNTEFPAFDSIQKNGRNLNIWKSVNDWKNNKYTTENSENPNNQTPIERMHQSYEDSNKSLNRLVKQRSHNVTENLDHRQELLNTDFIVRIMTSLESLNPRGMDSSNVSKLKDETIKSMDIGFSPDLGKTKDTSAFSGAKFMNNMNSNKTNLSANNNSSILGSNLAASKLILGKMSSSKHLAHDSSDSFNTKKAQFRHSYKEMKRPHKSTQFLHKPGDLTSKSKYLTDNIKPHAAWSFAAKIDAFNRLERSRRSKSKKKAKLNINLQSKNWQAPTVSHLMKCNSTRTCMNCHHVLQKELSEPNNATVKMNKLKRVPSWVSNFSQYSKKNFSSICYSKERKKIGSDSASIMSDFSHKKTKRVGSFNANIKLNGSSKKTVPKKKKAKGSRNNSSKRSKKFVKNIQYRSPGKLLTHNYSKKIKNNLEKFRKQYLNKKSWSSKVFSTDPKSKKIKKSVSKRRKQFVPNNAAIQQNIKMKTINLADSRNFDDYSSKNNSYIFNVKDNQSMKKSATVTSLFGTQHPIENPMQNDLFMVGNGTMVNTNEDRRERIDFYNQVFGDQKQNIFYDSSKKHKHEMMSSHSTNVISKFWNEPIEPPSMEMVSL